MSLLSIKREVDIVPGVTAPVVYHVSQGDVGTNVILGLLNYGTSYTVPSGSSVIIIGSASNGAVFTPVAATFSGSDVTFALSEEMSAVAGPTLCEAQIELNGDILGTANFIINVEPSPMGGDVPPVFTDAAWLWMLGKMETEIVPEILVAPGTDATIINGINEALTAGRATQEALAETDERVDAVAPGFSSSSAYTKGDYVYASDGQAIKLWRFIADHAAGSGWIGTDVEEVTVGSELNRLENSGSGKADESTIAPEFDTSTSYTTGQYVYKNGVLYRFTAAHSGTWTGTDAEVVTVGGEVEDLQDNYISLLDNATLSGWESGNFDSVTGANNATSNYIRNQAKVGISTGTKKIICDSGYKMLLFAWDTNGTFIGSSKVGIVFDKTTTNFLTLSEFDCSLYPNYVIKVALKRDPTSSEIVAAEGVHCHFLNVTDKSLTAPNKAADAKAVGDILHSVAGIVKNWSLYTNTSEDVTVMNGYIRTPDQTYPGRIDSSTTRTMFYFQAPSDGFAYVVTGGTYDVVRVSDEVPTVSSSVYQLVRYSAVNTRSNPISVKAGQYIATSSNAGTTKSNLYFAPLEYGLNDNLLLTAGMDNQIQTELFTQKTLNDFGVWVNGYWAAVNDLRTGYNYKAACSDKIVFKEDTLLVSYEPYYIKGYVNGVNITRTTSILIPKNATAYLFMEQINEDTSITVDPVEVASCVKVVNEHPYDEYNLVKNSFYGFGMFRSIGICGDSYSAVRLGHSWGQVVSEELGINVSNFSKSGDNTGTWINDTAHGLPVLLSSAKCDLYWIALGINDAAVLHDNVNYLGSANDLSGDDPTQYPDTFWGNMGQIIERISAYAPKAKIVLYKPIFGSASTAMGITNTTNMPAIRTAIGQIAEHYSLPVTDALDDIFFRSPEYKAHMDTATGAGNHPAVMLNPGIAHANMRLFSKCVAEYDTYFMDIDYSS